MIKGAEEAHPDSCWNRARKDQMVFVLIEGDPAAAKAIREWCAERVQLGKNQWGDVKIREAQAIAGAMEEQK